MCSAVYSYPGFAVSRSEPALQCQPTCHEKLIPIGRRLSKIRYCTQRASTYCSNSSHTRPFRLLCNCKMVRSIALARPETESTQDPSQRLLADEHEWRRTIDSYRATRFET